MEPQHNQPPNNPREFFDRVIERSGRKYCFSTNFTAVMGISHHPVTAAGEISVLNRRDVYVVLASWGHGLIDTEATDPAGNIIPNSAAFYEPVEENGTAHKVFTYLRTAHPESFDFFGVNPPVRLDYDTVAERTAAAYQAVTEPDIRAS